jgi:hypothetical protein
MTSSLVTGLILAFAFVLLVVVRMGRDLMPSRRRNVLRRLIDSRDPKPQRELGMGYVGLGMMEDDGLITGVKQPDGRRFYVITPAGVDYLLEVW